MSNIRGVYQNFKTLGGKIKIILQFCVRRIITREGLVSGHKPQPNNNPEQTPDWKRKTNFSVISWIHSNTQITLQNGIEKKNNNNNILHLILLMYDEHGTKVA